MIQLNLKLPEEFFNDEEREGYFVSHEMKQVWAVELDLLNEFTRVCHKYNIKYFADAGTMLGIIRHGGFIPWDDDIDIIMKREEYMKLDKVAQKEFQHPYFWQTERTDPGSMRGHAQLRNSETTGILFSNLEKKYQFNQGIFIDIFPLDYLPEDSEEREKFLSEVQSWRKKALHNAYYTSRFQEKGNGAKRIVRNWYHNYLSRTKKPNRDFEKFEKMMMTYDAQPTMEIGKLFFPTFDVRTLWKSEWVQESEEMPFEMLKIPVLNSYEKILTYVYGNWHTPVKGASVHGEVFFDVNKPYTKYIIKD